MKTLLSPVTAIAAIIPIFANTELQVHPDRAAQIETIRLTPNILWQAAPHPRFASSPPGASASLLGVLSNPTASVSHLVSLGEILDISSTPNTHTETTIPETFDSATHWPHCAKIISDVRDQSNCGCCWAFAGAEAASDRMCIATNGTVMVPLSAQDVCFNGGGSFSQGCNGGQVTDPWKYLQKGGGGAVSGGQFNGTGPFGSGYCSDFSMPHCHHHGPQGDDPFPAEGDPGCKSQTTPVGPSVCDGTAVEPHHDFEADRYYFDGRIVTANGEASIQRAVMAGGPMEVSFTVFEDFENYSGGIYHHVTGKMSGGHAVKLIGWGVEDGVKYWTIANSWNKHWGEKGNFRILRGVDEGGIENGAIASCHRAKWSRVGDDAGVGGPIDNPMGYSLKGSIL